MPAPPVDSPAPSALRVHVVQEVLPHYRVPLFDRIGRTPGIALTVWSDPRRGRGSLEPADATAAFATRPAEVRSIGPFLWQPAMLAAARDADVLVLPWHAWSLCVPVALRLARRRRIRTLVWGHGVSKRETRVRRWCRYRLLHLADGCIVYSRGAVDRLRADGFPASKVHLALNAIDQTPIEAACADWRGHPDELEAFRRREGLANREVVLFISRLEAGNRADQLLRAIDRIRRRRPAVLLVIIGDGGNRAALEQLAGSLGLETHVRFLGALYDQHEIAPWALDARLCAYPANIGLSLLHAFGYGLPVVTSSRRSGHGPEIELLRDGENGCFYQDGSDEDLAARIVGLLADPDRLAAMSDQARATVRGPGGATMEGMASAYLDALRAVSRRDQA